MLARIMSVAVRHPLINLGAAIGLAVALQGLVGCTTQEIVHHENNLAAAGFIIRPANTPDRQAMLKRLPPHQFIRREQGDTVTYVYADPLVCGCLYVGSQQAYNQYRRDQMQQQLADEQQMSAQMYSDAAWNWSAWGPWPPEYGIAYQPAMGW